MSGVLQTLVANSDLTDVLAATIAALLDGLAWWSDFVTFLLH
ncbi:hypothetical protein [Pseudonocardia yunnanensis]|uniref:Uncharacterized protein n=1 Tax=Pseudonocardia yunnanensis TaxID=58107 RepID=A0ABW4F9E3_9PSEU